MTPGSAGSVGRGHVVQPISLSLPAAGASATADRGRASLTGYIRLLCFVLKLLDRLQRRQHRFGGGGADTEQLQIDRGGGVELCAAAVGGPREHQCPAGCQKHASCVACSFSELQNPLGLTTMIWRDFQNCSNKLRMPSLGRTRTWKGIMHNLIMSKHLKSRLRYRPAGHHLSHIYGSDAARGGCTSGAVKRHCSDCVVLRALY